MSGDHPKNLSTITKKLWPRFISGLSLVICLGAIATVYQTFHTINWPLVWTNINHIPLGQVGLALIFVGYSYGAIACYDLLAFRYIQRHLALWKIIFAGLMTYSISPNVGFAFLSGSVLRYRLYRQWKVSNLDIAKIIAFTNISLWVGLIPLAGFTFFLSDIQFPEIIDNSFKQFSTRQFGLFLLVLSGLYLILIVVLRQPIQWRTYQFQFPDWQLTLQQITIFTLDWGFAALTLHFLLGNPLAFPSFFGIYIIAMVLGLISTVPGGLGVFETVITFCLKTEQSQENILATLIVFRCLYYFLPFAIAVFALLSFEIRQRIT